MRVLSILVFLAACGGKHPAPAKKQCEPVAAGQAMTEERCKCDGGRVVLSVERSVELHCEPDEHELGLAKIGDRTGWCCK